MENRDVWRFEGDGNTMNLKVSHIGKYLQNITDMRKKTSVNERVTGCQ